MHHFLKKSAVPKKPCCIGLGASEYGCTVYVLKTSWGNSQIDFSARCGLQCGGMSLDEAKANEGALWNIGILNLRPLARGNSGNTAVSGLHVAVLCVCCAPKLLYH